MTVDEVMQYRRAEPFKPFVLELKDGRRFIVRQPTHIGRNAASTVITVAADEDSFETFPGTLVARVKFLGSSNGHKRRRRR
jgi:hypothetical protein